MIHFVGYIVEFVRGSSNCHFCQVASPHNRVNLIAASRPKTGTIPVILEATMKYVLLAILLSGLGIYAGAQAPPPSQGSQTGQIASSPAQSIGMFAYPKNSQNADTQLKDENDCYASAKQQSGVDPQGPPPATKSADQKAAEQKAAAANAPQAKGGRVRGAARGAAAGAGLGAIAGDAGTGAAVGAAAGTMRGASQQRQANAASQKQAAANTAAQQQQQEQQANAAHAQSIDTFKRAFAACMDARNYSVK